MCLLSERARDLARMHTQGRQRTLSSPQATVRSTRQNELHSPLRVAKPPKRTTVTAHGITCTMLCVLATSCGAAARPPADRTSGLATI